MKVQQAKSKAAIKGDGTCRHCRLAIKSGQWYATTQMPLNPITDRWFNLHIVCMKAIAADAPDDVDKSKEAFERLREKIHTSGNLFPNDPELQGV